MTFSIVFAYVSDITGGPERSAAFGQVSATFAASMVLSPAVGSLLDDMYGNNAVFGVATLIAFIDVLYIIIYVPESMPEHVGVRPPLTCSMNGVYNPFSAMRMMFSSPLITRLSVMVFFSYLPESGEYQSLMMYLETAEIGFSKGSVAAWIAVFGVASIVAQTSILSRLAEKISQKQVITIGLIFLGLQLLVFGLFTNHNILFANAFLAGMGSITYPAISALVSHTTHEDQQGAVQGMTTGIRALCTGLGPGLFGVLFHYSDMIQNTLGPNVSPEDVDGGDSGMILPGVPFLIAALPVLAAMAVNWSIPEHSSNHLPEQDSVEYGSVNGEGLPYPGTNGRPVSPSSEPMDVIPKDIERLYDSVPP